VNRRAAEGAFTNRRAHAQSGDGGGQTKHVRFLAAAAPHGPVLASFLGLLADADDKSAAGGFDDGVGEVVRVEERRFGQL